MLVIELTYEQYKKKWEELNGNRMYELPNIDPKLKQMKVLNSPYDNEYERLMDEWRNPPMPRQITVYTEDGMEVYVIGFNK